MNKKKRAAMELSIGTIVIIVLAMSMLVLGLILLKNIFDGGNDIVTITNDQLLNEVKNLFGNEDELTLYPASKQIDIEQEEDGGFGIGIRNEGSTAGTFSYVVEVSDPDLLRKCNVGKDIAESWIQTGRAEDNIILPPGGVSAQKVLMKIPRGSAICTFRLRVNLMKDGQPYASAPMDIIIKA